MEELDESEEHGIKLEFHLSTGDKSSGLNKAYLTAANNRVRTLSVRRMPARVEKAGPMGIVCQGLLHPNCEVSTLEFHLELRLTEAVALGDMLKDPQCKLTKLDLGETYVFEGDSARALFQGVKQCKSLKVFSASFHHAGAFPALCDLLSGGCTLEDFGGMLISDKAVVPHLFAALGKVKALKHLNVSGSSTPYGQCLTAAVLKWSFLTTLNVSRSGLKTKSIVALCTVLPRSLQELYLSDNPVRDTGAKALAVALASGGLPALWQLHLEQAEIGPEGALALAKSGLGGVQRLVVSNNRIGDIAAAELVGTGSELVRLELSYCGLSERGAIAVTHKLVHAVSALRELDLGGVDGPDLRSELCKVVLDPRCKLEVLETSLKAKGAIHSAVSSPLCRLHSFVSWHECDEAMALGRRRRCFLLLVTGSTATRKLPKDVYLLLWECVMGERASIL
jgi:Leucine-rich repeat (LRR) protein